MAPHAPEGSPTYGVPNDREVNRNASEELLAAGYMPIAPDLAVEVLSPNDHAYEVDQKVDEYFGAGVRLIWIVNPEKRTVIIHRPDGTVTKLTAKDALDGEDVVPGCPVHEFFPDDRSLKSLGLL